MKYLVAILLTALAFSTFSVGCTQAEKDKVAADAAVVKADVHSLAVTALGYTTAAINDPTLIPKATASVKAVADAIDPSKAAQINTALDHVSSGVTSRLTQAQVILTATVSATAPKPAASPTPAPTATPAAAATPAPAASPSGN